MAPLKLNISKLLGSWEIDPFEEAVWMNLDRPITREEVAEALQCDAPGGTARESHAHRIATFVRQGWDDPIDVDLGVPVVGFYPDWPILDGNHRWAAAVYRGDDTIMAFVDGQVDWINEFTADGVEA